MHILSIIHITAFCLVFWNCSLHATATDSDPLCVVEISNVTGHVSYPNLFSDYWCSTLWCDLSNGLIVRVPSKYWVHQSQATEEVNNVSSLLKGKGSVHFFRGDVVEYFPKSYSKKDSYEKASKGYCHTEFCLIPIESSCEISIDLRIDPWANFNHLPKITSIKEDMQVIQGGIWDENRYSYLVELSDGTSWMTKEPKNSWEEYQQFLEMRVMIIGTNEDACLIRVIPTNEKILTSADCFIDMQRVK